jgi:hypothetical protein
MNVPIIPGHDPVTIDGRSMDEIVSALMKGIKVTVRPATPAVPTLADLCLGDLMFGPIGGFIPGVIPVGAGQIVLAPRKARLSWRQWWKVRHVGVVSRYAGDSGPLPWDGPRLVQAMPSGAEEIPMTPARHWTAEYVYLRPAYKIAATGYGGMTEQVAEAARGYVGTPYNFLTYAKLAAGALHLPTGLLRKWISTRHDMMCSQLADQALADAGFHVFDDGRLPQDVVPAELFRALLEMPGTRMLVPGGQWIETVS